MDNDLMARRLRPPSQPTPSQNGQSHAARAGPTEGWDEPLAPDPAARADVPWDRPAPEPWPPRSDDQVAADPWQTDAVAYETWQSTAPQPALPGANGQFDDRQADANGSYREAPPTSPAAGNSDPYDSMAPVVGDVGQPPTQTAWSDWNGNGAGATRDRPERAAAPEAMAVAARKDTWPGDPIPPAPWNEPPPQQVPEEFEPVPDQGWAEPPHQVTPPQPVVPQPVVTPPPVAPLPPAPPPVAPPPPMPHEWAMSAPAPAQPAPPANMVLRIELAIVDESERLSPVDAARRVGPVVAPGTEGADPGYMPRHPEFEPRNHVAEQPPQHFVPPPTAAPQAPPPLFVSPPANVWQPPAPSAPRAPEPPVALGWDLPPLAPPSAPQPAAPWETPPQPAPSSHWVMPQPSAQYAPSYQPEQPSSQVAWPEPAQVRDPLAGLPAASFDSSAPQAYGAAIMPGQAVIAGGAAAASSRARTGQAAADQADLWFLSNQPSAATAVEVDNEPQSSTSSLLTAGLTVGFAILVIVLVLVFIQLMTSLLR